MISTKQQILKIFDKNSNGYISLEEIDFLFKKILGNEWFLLEQETIYFSLRDIGIIFDDGDYSIFLNKLNALKTFFNSDGFFEDINIFQNMVLAFNEIPIEIDVFQDIDVVDILFSLKQLSFSKFFSIDKFSEDLKKYIASVSKEEGFILLPKELSFCQKYLDQLNSSLAALEIFKKTIEEELKSPVEETDPEEIVGIQVLKIKRAILGSNIRDKVGI